MNGVEESSSEEERGGTKNEKNNTCQVPLVLGLVGCTVTEVKIKKEKKIAHQLSPLLFTQDLGLTKMIDENESSSLLTAGFPSTVLFSHTHI